MSNGSDKAAFWLLWMVLPGRWGRWWTGSLIFGGMLLLFVATEGLFLDSRDPGSTATGVALFFCLILAYIVPIHHLIIERSVLAIDQLSGFMNADPAQVASWRQRLRSKSGRWIGVTIGIGLLAGLGHNLLLVSGNESEGLFAVAGNLVPLLMTQLVWLVMTSVISSLIDNALLFRRLARSVRIDLLNSRALNPFGSVAVSSTLAMIGAQAAFPLMMLETDVTYITFVPGLIATGVPLIFLFLLPTWPVHRRILISKRTELDLLTAQLQSVPRSAVDEPPGYERLAALLVYRREIMAASEWPFDTSAMGRLALYLIIPPLTWIGAALIEILIDSAL